MRVIPDPDDAADAKMKNPPNSNYEFCKNICKNRKVVMGRARVIYFK